MPSVKERVAIFTDRFPYLGPAVWMASVQFFIAEWFVANAWRSPVYSYHANAISDLGVSSCVNYAGRVVCSPLSPVMNGSLMFLGVLMALGALFIYQEFRESRASLVGFVLMALAGLGVFVVGLVPENVIPALHDTGAFFAFGFGHLSLIMLTFALPRVRFSFRVYTLLSGLLGLTALALSISHLYTIFRLGLGTTERIVVYPLLLWLIFFGVYMSASHYHLRRSKIRFKS